MSGTSEIVSMAAGTLFLLAVFVLVPIFVPMAARSWRMFAILVAATGLIVALAWLERNTADWDKDRMFAGLVAMATTASWVIGIIGGSVRQLGRTRGWRIARFPITEILAVGAAIALLFLWWLVIG